MTTTTHTPHTSGIDTVALAEAIRSRDAEAVTAFFADDATLTLHDRDHPPSRPQVYRGTQQIGAYFRDVCGRNVEHEVRDAVSTDAGLAYTQHCRYPDGALVLCSAVATVAGGRILTQTAVQVWD
ncbi:MAG: nuclear transport factor 2 family protein [Marmoricola sp.]|nr:nuclear transport factor 2 family protein [Marmoricola sp.]